jgi:DNA repair exonuclease SbcCD ATPase subunit
VADATKDDVQNIVRDAVRDLKSEFSHMRDQIQRIDKRTDDLDESQREINELFKKFEHVYPRLDELVNLADEIDRMRRDVEDVRLRTQNIEQGVAAITVFLQQVQKEQRHENGFRQD